MIINKWTYIVQVIHNPTMDKDNLKKIFCTILVVVVAATIGLLASSFKSLGYEEVGIKYDTVTMNLHTEPSYEGLHIGPPGFYFIKFPNVAETIKHDMDCLNKDGVIIKLDINYQYTIKPDYLNQAIKEFKDHETYNDLLRFLGESAIIDACRDYNVSMFQSQRGGFQDMVYKHLKPTFEDVSANLMAVQVNSIWLPSDYEHSVDRMGAAQAEISVALNERPSKLTQANTVEEEAKISAEIAIDKAYSTAKILITQAKANADAILTEFKNEADSYAFLKSEEGLGLDTKSFLAYMSVRALEESDNPVQISMDAPAKTNFFD